MLTELQDDIEQFNVLRDNFEALNSEDGDTAYKLALQMIVCADRWCEIALNISKYASELENSKTNLYNWAYHKYRILMTMHEFCRVVYRQCREEMNNAFRNEM